MFVNFTFKLHTEFEEDLRVFLGVMNKQLNFLLQQDYQINDLRKIKFRNQLLEKLAEKPYYDELFGNKAKYFRILIEQYRQILASQQRRLAIIKILQSNGHVYQDLIGFRKPSFAELANIKSSIEQDNTCQTTALAEIDYSSEDEQISHIDWSVNETHYLITARLKYSSQKLCGDNIITHQCRIPKKQIAGNVLKFTRPVIRLLNGQLCISYRAEITGVSHVKDTDSVLGVDLGLVKPFSAVAVCEKNGFQAISDELTYSSRVKHLSNKLVRLQQERERVYAKCRAYELLGLTGEKYEKLKAIGKHLRSKAAKLKDAIGFLVANEIVKHAVDYQVSTVHMENLKFVREKAHTTWDFSRTQQKIKRKAEIHHIKVKRVSAKHTSKHNPFTLEAEEVDANRRLVKCLFDRDYAAAILIASRKKRENLDDFHAVSRSHDCSTPQVMAFSQLNYTLFCKLTV